MYSHRLMAMPTYYSLLFYMEDNFYVINISKKYNLKIVRLDYYLTTSIERPCPTVESSYIPILGAKYIGTKCLKR